MDFLFHQNFTPVTVVRHCIRRQCFTLLPNVWVVFKIYFAILHKIATINNVQQSLKQAKGTEFFCAVLHYIQSVMLHIRVVCTTSSQSCYTSGSFALHPVRHVTHPGRLHYIQSVMLHIQVVCTTSSQSCYTSGSFAFSTWLHGRDVICKRCVVIFLKTVNGVTFNLI